MDREFTDTQRLLRDTLRDYLQREVEPLVEDL